MKKIQVLIATLILLGITSCSSDFLDVTPSDANDAESSVNTADDAEVMMTGIMRNMTSADYYGRNFIIYADAKSGDLTTVSMGRGLDNLYSFDHSPTTGAYGGFWQSIYNNILQVNNLIENIDKIEEEGIEEAAEKESFEDIKGQALTARALMYFDLVRIYGKAYSDDKSAYGVPNVTEPLESTEKPERASVETNYEQIITDLEEAETLLSKDLNDGYLNYYANKALQARVFLNMEHHDEALVAAEEVIDSEVYSLYSNNEWVSSWTKQFGSESIFELAMEPDEGDLESSSLSIYLRRHSQESASAIGQFVASDYYLSRLGEDANDVRWGMMDYDEIGEDHLGASYKYSGDTNLNGDGASTSTGVNIKVIRLSELYLIAAEAALKSDKSLAADYLNAIRKRAPDLPEASAGNIDIDMILDERSKELFTEGHRFFDLIRLNKTIEFNDDLGGVPISAREKSIDRSFYKTILPIPQEEINANPDIEEQQNPEY